MVAIQLESIDREIPNFTSLSYDGHECQFSSEGSKANDVKLNGWVSVSRRFTSSQPQAESMFQNLSISCTQPQAAEGENGAATRRTDQTTITSRTSELSRIAHSLMSTWTTVGCWQKRPDVGESRNQTSPCSMNGQANCGIAQHLYSAKLSSPGPWTNVKRLRTQASLPLPPFVLLLTSSLPKRSSYAPTSVQVCSCPSHSLET